MIGKKIPVVFRIMFVIWVILQVCLVIKYWDMPNHDDAQAYVKLASECIARGTWYPDVHNQYEDFIFGPGYVNLLIGIYHLCGSFSFVRLLNLFAFYFPTIDSPAAMQRSPAVSCGCRRRADRCG